MKNYYNFLERKTWKDDWKTGEYIKNLSIEDTIKLIKHTKVWKTLVQNKFEIPEENLIFRQIQLYEEQYQKFNFVDPTTITRTSPYASTNLYNLVFSNLPSWTSYPKRNKSLICGDKEAVEYRDYELENSYVVLPFKSKIGVCSSHDIWQSFNDSILYNINQFFNIFKEDVEFYLKEDLHDNDWNIFIKQLETYDKKRKLNASSFIREIKIPKDKWLSKKQSTLKLLNDVFNPNANGFIIYKYDGSEELPTNKEMWTDSHSLLIKYEEWDELLNYIKSKKNLFLK